jgi:peptidoglycan biosynthesis protein MviN/MurJ (putative lipid II flippase)
MLDRILTVGTFTLLSRVTGFMRDIYASLARTLA